MRKSEATQVLTLTPSRGLKPAAGVGETAGALCSVFPWRPCEPLRSAGVGFAAGAFDLVLCWSSDEPLSAAAVDEVE